MEEKAYGGYMKCWQAKRWYKLLKNVAGLLIYLKPTVQEHYSSMEIWFWRDEIPNA